MRRRIMGMAALLTATAGATPVLAQTWAVEDPVLQRIWEIGQSESQVMDIAQALMDSIGPRLTGTPGHDNAVDWAVQLLSSWGVDARKEQYGTWNGWRRGITHVDLIQPRVRSLEGMMLAWSRGSRFPVSRPRPASGPGCRRYAGRSPRSRSRSRPAGLCGITRSMVRRTVSVAAGSAAARTASRVRATRPSGWPRSVAKRSR